MLWCTFHTYNIVSVADTVRSRSMDTWLHWVAGRKCGISCVWGGVIELQCRTKWFCVSKIDLLPRRLCSRVAEMWGVPKNTYASQFLAKLKYTLELGNISTLYWYCVMRLDDGLATSLSYRVCSVARIGLIEKAIAVLFEHRLPCVMVYDFVSL